MSKAFAITALLLLVTITGCATPQQREQREAERRRLQSELSDAQSRASVSCSGKASCDKAFSLAKLYMQDNSHMRMQFSDDTTATTYNPTDYGYVGLTAKKIPGKGDSAEVTLTGTCRGMYDGGFYFFECAQKLIRILNDFPPYIEKSLK